MRLALLIGVAVAGLKAKALLSYQLPVIVTCCIQSFLADCNFDHDCAMARFLANATLNNAGDTLLQNCVEAEKASINGSPGILERARALAAMPGCLRQGTKGGAKTRSGCHSQSRTKRMT